MSFRSRYGTFKYRVMPFGLTNTPATFQRFINDILMEYLDVFCSGYMDDIFIYSESVPEYEVHVKKVMGILQANNLQVDIKKSEPREGRCYQDLAVCKQRARYPELPWLLLLNSNVHGIAQGNSVSHRVTHSYMGDS